MNDSYLSKLEYDKILELLSKHSVTYLGKELCEKLKPNFKSTHVAKLLQETSEARNLIMRKGNLAISPIANIDICIKSLESSYSLSAKELLDIGKILKLVRELKNYFYKDENIDLSEFSNLDVYFSSLYSNKKIEDEILNAIIDENVIADNASTILSSLRRSRRKLENEIKETLNNMIHSPTYSKYIMEAIVTIRNDRYVIPVKEEYRGNIKGFIHDVSSSGSTVFVEPMSVFEMNNKISNIKMEEVIEIEKILHRLSTLLFPICGELSRNVELIGILDFIFAKAKFSNSINANCPNINESKFIKLNKARHPLIDKDRVVPIDIEIGQNYTSLIITGPNTGGKTVALKTVGLLTLMACSGLHIPALEDSSIYVFDHVFADIGDEQSIQESLSTFSAHMINTINIINNVTSNSLVLLDELGSGTDPVEGASLAAALLEHLYNCGCLTIATTHYQEIKNYALVTDGFENASSEFDIDNLKPTYKLLMGIPGKSNAFAISQKLGLPDEILNRAMQNIKNDDISVEELLKNIYDDKVKIEKDKSEIDKNLVQIEALRKSLETENILKKKNENEIIEKAKLQAHDIILSTKEDANYIIKELEDILDKWKVIDNANIANLSDGEIAKLVKDIKINSVSRANKLRNKLKSSLDSLYDNNNSTADIKINDLKENMQIRLSTISDIATIISIPSKGKQIQVQVGNIKMNANISDIVEIVNLNNTEANKYNSNIDYKSNVKSSIIKAKTVSTEINVIGQNVDEACFVIDKYLDDAALAKLQSVRIVHGKGTGKLREGIHTFLRKHPHVKSYRIGSFGEGEMGVTIVEIK